MDIQKHKASSEKLDRPGLQEPEDREASDGLLVVGIGASAGGLKALEAFFSHLPETPGMAFVVIVHLSPEHESQMAALLQQHTVMPVAQVSGPVHVEAGHVYVIPPGKVLSMTDGHIHLSDRSQHGHAPIDLFFRTLAETHGRHAVAVVLSGTGSDGAVGLGRVKERGGLTMAQSPEEAEYDTMPRSAVATGHVELVLPVAEMARTLQEYRQSVGRRMLPEASESLSAEDGAVLAKIFAHLRARTGHDFIHYKHATILRRLTRRLHLSGMDDLAAYLGYLRDNADEVHHLLKDLLLTVTNFFRDPEAFAVLEKVIPKLFTQKAPGEAVRAWVCGCATGEEAYSIAVLLGEEAERLSHPAVSQVFASDISEGALRVAREGLYPAAIASDVPTERLNRFFDQESGGYRIKHEVREKIVFAVHNLLQDPPFSRLDLVTCRNVLIYLDRSVHRRIFELFHYALRPGGYLFLGNAESIDTPDLFRAVDRKQGLYERRAGAPVIRLPLSAPAAPLDRDSVAKPDAARAGKPLDVEALHGKLITPYVPPSVIVSSDHQVVHTLGGGEAYLTFTPGRPTQDILKVVREELRLELRTALYQAFRKAERTRSRAIPVRVEGTLRQVELLVEPITEPSFAGDHAHVLFREVEAPAHRSGGNRSGDARQEAPHAPDAAGPSSLQGGEGVIRQLEDELHHVKEQLHTTTEEHEAANEEMKAANEEMQSINEELRSTMEELETSKEELQSVNEELLALNDELKSKIEEIGGINSDLQNLMNATEIGTIFLDRHLRVKRYTPQVEKLFKIAGADVGLPLAALTHQLGSDALPDDAACVLRELTMIEREVQHSANQQWFLVRLRPYHSVEGAIEGVVITFVDVTDKKKYDEQLEALIKTLEELLTTRAEQIKRLASELILAEQTERQRIAQILHDDLQQLLFAFQVRVNPLSQSLSKKHAARLAQATTLIDRALDVTRTLTAELSPPVLKGEDITVTLDYLVIQMEDLHGLKVAIEFSGPVYLPPDVHRLVYQLVHELLFNVVKHAGVDRARVNLVREENQLVLLVEDEGAGFDMAAAQELGPTKQGGFGLRSIWERLHLFGGRLDMEAAPGQGTRATLVVPLENDASGGATTRPGDEDAKPDPN